MAKWNKYSHYLLILSLLLIGLYFCLFYVSFNGDNLGNLKIDEPFANANINANANVNANANGSSSSLPTMGAISDDNIISYNKINAIGKTNQIRASGALPKVFDKSSFDCYVINLTKNKDRLQYFNRSYTNSDLSSNPFIRVNAIYGKDIPYTDYIDKNADPSFKSPGMVGCFLSHLDTYSKIQNSEKPYALIFEDDAKINPLIYQNTISKLHETIPDDWDIILLGYMLYDPTHKYEVYNKYIKMFHFWGLHGYLINKKAVNKILSIIKSPFQNQIDHILSKHARTGELKIYGVKEVAVSQNAKYTDVQV